MMQKRLRASVICVHLDALLVVDIQDPLTQIIRPFLPGGKIESGESPPAAAKREAFEESGFEVAIDLQSERIKAYPFSWGGIDIACETHFYRGRLLTLSPVPVDDGPFNKGARWIKLSDVPREFGYHQVILQEILAILKST